MIGVIFNQTGFRPAVATADATNLPDRPKLQKQSKTVPGDADHITEFITILAFHCNFFRYLLQNENV